MTDRGFDIQDNLTLLKVKVNIPPFWNSKKQLEMIETRWIPGLIQDFLKGGGWGKIFNWPQVIE